MSIFKQELEKEFKKKADHRHIDINGQCLVCLYEYFMTMMILKLKSFLPCYHLQVDLSHVCTRAWLRSEAFFIRNEKQAMIDQFMIMKGEGHKFCNESGLKNFLEEMEES